jgi:hypothetical protein
VVQLDQASTRLADWNFGFSMAEMADGSDEAD